MMPQAGPTIMQTQPFLDVAGIDKSFAGVQALKAVSFKVFPGERLTLVGENGSGKSTIIKIIAGVLDPDAGAITVGGTRYDRLKPGEAIDLGIQVIYQDFSLFPNLTVAENLVFDDSISSGRRLMNWREARDRARCALEMLGVDIPVTRAAGSLTTADRQLVAIAKSLMRDARLIIMDEPTTALTRREVGKLLSIVDDLKARGISTIFVSHKLEEILQISDRAVVLRNGEKVLECDAAAMTRAGIVEAMSGVRLEERRIVHRSFPASPLLEVRGLSRPRAFADVDFSLHAGEVLGITGLRGSGRSELALSLFGMLPPISGEVRMDGRRVHLGKVADALRLGIALVPEDRLRDGLFYGKPIAINAACRILDRLRGRGGLLDFAAILGEVRRWVGHLGIKTSDPRLPVSSLSGGNQQKVVLAKWLMTEPRLLILNNPTAGVDIRSKMEINRLVRQLADDGMALIVISDDLPEVLQVSDRILVMKGGRVIDRFAADDVDEQRLSDALLREEAVHA